MSSLKNLSICALINKVLPEDLIDDLLEKVMCDYEMQLRFIGKKLGFTNIELVLKNYRCLGFKCNPCVWYFVTVAMILDELKHEDFDKFEDDVSSFYRIYFGYDGLIDTKTKEYICGYGNYDCDISKFLYNKAIELGMMNCEEVICYQAMLVKICKRLDVTRNVG